MNRRSFSRITGIFYIIGAVFGLVISIGGLTMLWTTRDTVTNDVTGLISLTGRTLTATRDTIRVVGDSLQKAEKDLDLATKMIDDVTVTLRDSSDMIASTGNLVGVELVQFVNDTQTSLTSVQTSARVVDDFLRLLSNIPIVGGRYRPEIPLEESVARVSKSIRPMPDSLQKISRDLETSSANAATVRAEIENLSTQVKDIKGSLVEARVVVDQYNSILVDVQTRFDRYQKRIPILLDAIYMGLTFLLVWIFITQVGALINGLQMVLDASRPVE